MRIIIFLLVALSSYMAAYAQVPPNTSANAEKVSQDVFKTIGEFQNADDGGSDLEKLRLQDEGKRAMDDQANNLQGLANDKKSVVVFTANNKQTVLADKYVDTKRKLEEGGLELVRGQLHLKILHSPLK